MNKDKLCWFLSWLLLFAGVGGAIVSLVWLTILIAFAIFGR